MAIGLIDSKIATLKLGDLYPVRLMGVINLSKESFYKGSVVSTRKDALSRAIRMVEEGAELLDVGAMSTAPKVKHKTYLQEKERLMPSLKQLVDNVDVPISIDTYRSKIADAALSKGASIINDITGFTKDPEMVKVLKDHDAPAIIMATDDQPGDTLTIDEIINALLKSIRIAEKKGYDTEKIIIDPGIGLWVPAKTYKYNLDIINNLERLRCIGKPILVGISRKSFIGDVLNRSNPFDRLQGTLAATAIAVYNGAHIVRTHDVGATCDFVKLAQRVRGRGLSVEGNGYEVISIPPMLPQDSRVAMTVIGTSRTDAKVMSEKALLKTILVKKLTPKEAAVLRQEMLAIGGDVALSKDTIGNKGEGMSVIIMGTALQLKQLIAKLHTCKPNSLEKVGTLLKPVLKQDDLDFKYKYEFYYS